MADSDRGHGIEWSFLELLAVFARRWRLVVGIPLLLCLITGVRGLIAPRSWSSGGSFFSASASGGSGGGLAGLAEQFGISVAGASSGHSPDYYASLVRSRAVMERVAAKPYSRTVDGVTSAVQLADVYGVSGSTPEIRQARAVRLLRTFVTSAPDPRTAVVEFMVTAESPELAHQLATSILAEVQEVDNDTRRQRAEAEARFFGERATVAEQELRSAENRQAAFLRANRDYRNSPGLFIEYERIAREVQIAQAVFTSVRQGLEQARVEQLRDTPPLAVILQPSVPALPDARRLISRTVLAGFSGIMLGLVLALLLEGLAVLKARDPRGWDGLSGALSGAWREARALAGLRSKAGNGA